jgi:hypothetical protein
MVRFGALPSGEAPCADRNHRCGGGCGRPNSLTGEVRRMVFTVETIDHTGEERANVHRMRGAGG